jgi:phosphate transport system substrate-binding protein
MVSGRFVAAAVVLAAVACSFLAGCSHDSARETGREDSGSPRNGDDKRRSDDSARETGREDSEGDAVSAELRRFDGLQGKIDIAGGTAHIPVMNDAAKRIQRAFPDIRITVAGGGSGVGVEKVGQGLVEVGNTGRPLSQKEKDAHGLVTFPFAIDGVAVVVHPSNPVANLTPAAARDIYEGQITNWQDAGGEDQPINLFTRDEASGTREVFWEKLLAKGKIAEKANVVASNGAMKVAVAGDPGAIGYISLGHVDRTVKALRIDGVEASQANAAAGKYFVVRKLYMNTKGQPSPLVQALIDYIRGPEGATLITAAGYIPTQDE